ncbi:MAG: hypothetical protein SF187_30540 [Deltaproteobacteria bacterium]|nr:hypothetical protein [Deltaproteobacteria bacterium]
MTSVVAKGLLWVVLGVGLAACNRQAPQQPPAQDAHTINQGSANNGSAAGQMDEAPAAGGEPCGPVKCAANEVCCNQSCGICTAPGGVCTQQFCEPEPANDAAGVCKTDADCRATADYCTGCDCRALGPKQELPPCTGPGVRCLADPCMTKIAVCKAGRCETVAKR